MFSIFARLAEMITIMILDFAYIRYWQQAKNIFTKVRIFFESFRKKITGIIGIGLGSFLIFPDLFLFSHSSADVFPTIFQCRF